MKAPRRLVQMGYGIDVGIGVRLLFFPDTSSLRRFVLAEK